MKFILIGSFFLFLLSCKNEAITNYPKGIYVESTLRLDTIDFTENNLIDNGGLPIFNLKSAPFSEPSNPSITIYNTAIYQFDIKNNNTIDIRSMFSSNSNFQNVYFNWLPTQNWFEMDKFYYRNALASRLRFIKL